MKNTFTFLLFVLSGISGSGQICASSLDQTFGTGGIAVGNSSVGNANAFYSRNILVQSDNKIIQVCAINNGGYRFGVIRYKSNGILDSSLEQMEELLPQLEQVKVFQMQAFFSQMEKS